MSYSSTTITGGQDHPFVLPFNPADTQQIIGQINTAINAGLASSSNLIPLTGHDTLSSVQGNATIDAAGAKSAAVHGTDVPFTFIGGTGPATVLGGTGNETVFGGSGRTVVHGGSAGDNLLFAGTGSATLFGGGSGDQLYAEGAKAQLLIAGAGNETLSAALSTGPVTLVGGSGHDVMIGGKGHDVFEFIKGHSGGTDVVFDFSNADKVVLSGYGPNAVAHALASQVTAHGSTTITLSDDTKITFSGLTGLKPSNFG